MVFTRRVDGFLSPTFFSRRLLSSSTSSRLPHHPDHPDNPHILITTLTTSLPRLHTRPSPRRTDDCLLYSTTHTLVTFLDRQGTGRVPRWKQQLYSGGLRKLSTYYSIRRRGPSDNPPTTFPAKTTATTLSFFTVATGCVLIN